MKTTSAHCSTRMEGNVDSDGQRHRRLQHINVTLREEHTVNPREWQVWWSQMSAFGAVRHMPVLRQHPNTWQQQKDTTDAWYTICTRCDLIFKDTPELQRHLASTEYLPPEGHASVINAETSDSASGRETNTHQTATWRVEGRRDDGRARARGRKGTPRAFSQTRSCTTPSSRLFAPYHNKFGKSEAQSACAG